MNYLLLMPDGALSIAPDISPDAVLSIAIEPHSHLGDGVQLIAKLKATDTAITPDTVALELIFVDFATNDQIYKLVGTLDPEIGTNSLEAIVAATEEFKTFEVAIPNIPDFIDAVQNSDAFNEVNSLGRKSVALDWDSGPLESNIDQIFNILTEADVPPTRLAMAFTDNVPLFTQLVRVISKLNIRLFVELDPTLTVDQAIQVAQDLAPFDDRICFVWSPNLAYPLDAKALRGKKVPRLVLGTIMGWHTLRDAQTDTKGIPAYHNPIAGFDYPFAYKGMTKRADIVIGDPERKRLANAQICLVERQVFDTGVRFILGDVLTANGDNSKLLKLINASDIAMYIDNRVNKIIKRHLLKGMDTFIDDATKECVKFLDACTSKNRPLLVKSETLSGFYDLSITPREDKPFDAVNVENNYRPQGAARKAYHYSNVVE